MPTGRCSNDRLNALAKYTYFFNVPTADQISLQQTAAEFIQKSHVASVDVNYDLTAAWSIGGKYAYRLGEISLDREDPEYFDNSAQLLILRTDLRIREVWEGLVEARTLDLPDVDQTPKRRPGGRLPLPGRALQGRCRLQLHGLLGRPHGPELRPPGILHQPDREHVRVMSDRMSAPSLYAEGLPA